jgi:hypothetical protein
LNNNRFDAQEIGYRFQDIRRIVRELQALPEGAANQGADKIRELQAVLGKINQSMSDLGITVHLTPAATEASALAILTQLVSGFFLRFAGCDECPYYDRCLALVGFEYNDKECSERLFEWFSKADFPWLYPDRT